jgi:hypothetical protein
MYAQCNNSVGFVSFYFIELTFSKTVGFMQNDFTKRNMVYYSAQ